MIEQKWRPGRIITADAPSYIPDVAAKMIQNYLSLIGQEDKHKKFRISLCGGNTPFGLYKRLTQAPFKENIPWERLEFFMGDERFVPPEDPQNNFSRIKKTLFDNVPIKSAQLHPIDTNFKTPEQSAKNYQKQLQKIYGSDTIPSNKAFFDLTLLGLGDDGHTASLFPEEKRDVDKEQWVIPTYSPKEPHQRISLNYELINASRFILFIVTGQAKSDILREIIRGNTNLPASYIHAREHTIWLTDKQTLS